METRNRFYLIILLGAIYNLILMISESKNVSEVDQTIKIEQEMTPRNQKTTQ
jgi:hypothetical protein